MRFERDIFFHKHTKDKSDYALWIMQQCSEEVFREFNVLDGYEFKNGGIIVRYDGLVAHTGYECGWTSEKIAEMNRRIDREWLEERLRQIGYGEEEDEGLKC